MDLKIMKSTGKEWYDKCIGERFTIHSESKKGGRGKYVVRIPKHLRELITLNNTLALIPVEEEQ